MLAKQYRFHRQNAVNKVYKLGNTVRVDSMSLKYLRQSEPTDNRLAVVVSKKVDKRAVVRNRIRRRIYETFRIHWGEIESGYDLVLTVFEAQLAKQPYPDLEADVKKLLEKAKLLSQK